LWRRKWYVAIPTLVVVAITIPVVLSLPSLYQATTLIMVEPQKVPEEFVRATVTVPIQDRLKTISQQVLSRTRLERVIDEFSLFQHSTAVDGPQWMVVARKWVETLRRWIGYEPSGPVDGTLDRLSLVERMRNNIAITVTGGSTFSITYTGEDPLVVQQVTNKLASLFIDENLKVREEQAEGTAEFLESELERVKKRLEGQESEVRAFKQRYMGELPSQLDANLRTLDRLQMEKIALDEQLRNAKERFEVMSQIDLFGLSNTEDDGPVAPTDTRLQTLKGRLAELLRTYKEDYPDVVVLRREIAQLEAELDRQQAEEPPRVVPREPVLKVQKAPEDEISSTIASLKHRSEEVAKEIQRYQERVDNTFLREQQLSVILRDYETISKTYQVLLDKRQNARIAENLERRQKGEIFRILDPAELPERPFKPNRRLLIALGCLLGLGAGVGLAVLREQLDPSIRSERDLVQATTGIPLLSVIPFVLTVQSPSRPKTRAIPPPSIRARS
jgi:polysaccharide chain length determinant protein (PEP-CTERM system associated)